MLMLSMGIWLAGAVLTGALLVVDWYLWAFRYQALQSGEPRLARRLVAGDWRRSQVRNASRNRLIVSVAP